MRLFPSKWSWLAMTALSLGVVVVGGKVNALHKDLRRTDALGFTLEIQRNVRVSLTDYCDGSGFDDSDLFPGYIKLRITKPLHMVEGYICN